MGRSPNHCELGYPSVMTSRSFRLFWRWHSRAQRCGRSEVTEDSAVDPPHEQAITRRGGPPRIHGEILQLGFEIPEPTVSHYLQRLKQCPDNAKPKRWLVVLHKHREVIAAFDFFTILTLTFRVLYCSCHRASATSDSPLQYHGASLQRVDLAAIAGGTATTMHVPLYGLRP
jgi:hypothetical protein